MIHHHAPTAPRPRTIRPWISSSARNRKLKPAHGPDAPGAAPGLRPACRPDMIIEGDQKTFMHGRGRGVAHIPVLVDFWATWCGPCKQLTPTLEKVVRAAGGRVKLVKIDIDQNRALVQQLANSACRCSPSRPSPPSGRARSPTCSRARCPNPRCGASSRRCSSWPAAPCRAPTCSPRRRPRWRQATPRGRRALRRAAAAGAGKPRGLGRPDPRPARARRRKTRPRRAGPGARRRSPSTPRSPAPAARSPWPRKAARPPPASPHSKPRLAANPADHQARYDLATALNAPAPARGGGRRAAGYHPPRPQLERGRARALQLLKFFEAWGFDDPATMAARRKLSALLFSLNGSRCRCRRSPRASPTRDGIPGLPAARRAAAAARPPAAEHLRAALPGDDRGRARRAAACFGMIQPDRGRRDGPTGPALFRIGCLGRLVVLQRDR